MIHHIMNIFLTNEETWYKNLNKVKNYIIKNNMRPSQKDDNKYKINKDKYKIKT